VQEGITRGWCFAGGSQKCDARAERKSEQSAATDAHAVGDHIPEFHRATRREMLARLHEDSQKEH
jgi:hypothetical protein